MAAESLITRYSNPNETFTISVCCRNIANAQRDETMNPLFKRLPAIIRDMKESSHLTDIFVALEAGRPSQGHTWTEMASQIETETGMRYEHCSRLNASAMSFGKALFINPERVAISKVQQLWTSDEDIHIWGGDCFGNDILLVVVHPVKDGKVVTDLSLSVAFVHFPMKAEERVRVARWIQKWHMLADLWMGDFNTFSTGTPSAEEICKTIEGTSLKEIQPYGSKLTFQAFEHDLVKVPTSELHLISPESQIVDPTPDQNQMVSVRFASQLDRIFIKPTLLCTVLKGPITDASDHTSMHVTVVLQ